MKIKVCGMKYKDNIQQLGSLLPDYMGFIFYNKSSRFVAEKLPLQTLNQLPKSIKKVGVFVNDTQENILFQVKKYSLEFIQLHGDESVEFCSSLKQKGVSIIKAFQISENFDFNTISAYENCVDFFLFDTKTEKYGGSGKKFNWEILQQYNNNIPFFLSGGISIKDVSEIKNNPILQKLKIESIDINSRFETAPAKKNIPLISEFTKQIRNEL